MPELTNKQRLFVSEYMIDLNATQACIRCGYSARTANRMGSELLSKPVIQGEIARQMAERIERVQTDADYVLKRLIAIDQMDVADILNDDGTVKPIKDWPVIWRQYVSGVDLSEIFAGSGDNRALAGVLKKIRWPDKLKNLELLGKYERVQAWKEKASVDVAGEIKITRVIVRAE